MKQRTFATRRLKCLRCNTHHLIIDLRRVDAARKGARFAFVCREHGHVVFLGTPEEVKQTVFEWAAELRIPCPECAALPPYGWHYVYAITEKATGRRYVGYSNNPKERFRSHCSGRLPVDSYMRSVGQENFVLEVVGGPLEMEKARTREEELIKEWRTYDPRYGFNRLPQRLYQQALAEAD